MPASDATQHLDLLSTSQTHARCVYGAPLVAIIVGNVAQIRQACCNHWDCPACGQTRAKQEYRRITHGCEVLSEHHDLYFWTLTCRGREMTLEEAEENYLAWTNVVLTNARTKCKRSGMYWCYVQVTERQKKTRAHPHSHILTTFLPNDAIETTNSKGRKVFVSEWFTRANFSAGLGSQHEISSVRSASAVSRYVGKYLFKQSMADRFPPKWKRVRYSQNFPEAPTLAMDFSTPLMTPRQWQQAFKQGVRYECTTSAIYELAAHHLPTHVIARPVIDKCQ